MGAVTWGLGACTAAWFVALSVYDIKDRRLPNALTLPGAVAILLAAAVLGRGPAAACGALALAAVYLAVHLVSPAGMGAGDVKLAVGVGAVTGAFGSGAWLLAALAAPAFTAMWAVLVRRRADRTVPHGPSMCLAAAVAVGLAAAAA